MQTPLLAIAINDLPELAGEPALFDAGIDPSDLSNGDEHLIVSLVLNP